MNNIKIVKDFEVEPRDFYIYTHHKLTTGEIFYVGKGLGKRYRWKHRSTWWKNIAIKHGVLIKIHKDCLQEWCAFEFEKEMIALHGRQDDSSGNLINLTDGGDGVSGYTHTEKTRLLLSKSLTGRKLSSGTALKIGNALRGIPRLDDQNIYKLINKDLKIFEGTRQDFQKLYNITRFQSYRIIRYIGKTVKGWTLFQPNVDMKVLFVNHLADQTVYSFMNIKTGLKFKGTRCEFAKEIKESPKVFRPLFKTNPRVVVKNWTLVKEQNENSK